MLSNIHLSRFFAAVFVALSASASPDAFISSIESAHGTAAWPKGRALCADFSTRSGDKGWEGTFTMDRDMSLVRLDVKDGPIIVFDGKDVWMTPADSKFPGPRFWIFTPPYFALIPYKLRDEGARVVPAGSKSIDGAAYDVAKLTFAAGTGDAPDDWYLLFRDPKSGRLNAVAYIVTFARDAAKAELDPHMLRYLDVLTVDGVAISTRWQFFKWSESQGPNGTPLAEWKLMNLKFITPDAATFQRPEGARSVPMERPH